MNLEEAGQTSHTLTRPLMEFQLFRAANTNLMHVEKTFLGLRALVDLLGLISNGIDAPNCMAVKDPAGDIRVSAKTSD